MKLIKEMDKQTESKMKKAVFVGRLVTEDELVNTMIEAPVTFQDEDNEFIMFNVKCLSDIPTSLSSFFLYHNKIFRGSTKSYNNLQKIKSQLVPNYDRLLPADRKAKLIEALQNKIIIFSISQSNMFVHLEIVKIEDVEPKESYSLIPQPNSNMSESRSSLEERILSGNPITMLQYPNLFEDPEFIYFDNYLYSHLSFKQSDIPTTYYISNPESVKRIQVSHSFYEKVDSRIDNHLLIIEEKAMLDLRDEMEEEGENLWEAFRREKEELKTIDGRTDTNNKPSYPEDESKQEGLVERKKALEQGRRHHDDEMQFLEHLEQNAQIRGLYYDELDLYNFHTSVKTNLLTIIGGMSGTGKSQLARLYGETLGLSFGKDLVMIPVSPAYHEPNDILGYLNPTTGVYHESETGLVSLLLEAQKHPEQLFMVIFDEMNLSQVEHWFSPFISLLEIESAKRKLSLFNSGSYCVNERYKAQMQIGDNLIFVGTVNFDETTKNFSDRLLDRSNVIVPRKLSFKEVRDRQIHDIPEELQSFQIDTHIFRKEWTNSQFGELENLTDEEIHVLDELHLLLQQKDQQRGISFRVARGIAHYLVNIPTNASGKAVIPRGVAFDIQLKQRVLTKIVGAETVVGDLLGSFHGDTYQEGSLVQLLQTAEAQQISNHKLSIEIIKQKAKELMSHGYTN